MTYTPVHTREWLAEERSSDVSVIFITTYLYGLDVKMGFHPVNAHQNGYLDTRGFPIEALGIDHSKWWGLKTGVGPTIHPMECTVQLYGSLATSLRGCIDSRGA